MESCLHQTTIIYVDTSHCLWTCLYDGSWRFNVDPLLRQYMNTHNVRIQVLMGWLLLRYANQWEPCTCWSNLESRHTMIKIKGNTHKPSSIASSWLIGSTVPCLTFYRPIGHESTTLDHFVRSLWWCACVPKAVCLIKKSCEDLLTTRLKMQRVTRLDTDDCQNMTGFNYGKNNVCTPWQCVDTGKTSSSCQVATWRTRCVLIPAIIRRGLVACHDTL